MPSRDSGVIRGPEERNPSRGVDAAAFFYIPAVYVIAFC
jgi:hypothetical protein